MAKHHVQVTQLTCSKNNLQRAFLDRSLAAYRGQEVYPIKHEVKRVYPHHHPGEFAGQKSGCEIPLVTVV